jgi:cyclopropane fatty-acyl-phospholipid synthase-like methyltransferase
MRMIQYDDATLAERVLHPDAFPRAATYDARWQHENAMGPNPLWLAESLAELMELHPGMRVLDLGCGKAITSIFLAREYGLHVTAADLWVQPTENWERIKDAQLEDLVYPIHANAHDLKFADGYFDAVVSFDAYHYFGTDDLYIDVIRRFLRPGGQIGIVVPAFTYEFDEPPAHIAEAMGEAWDIVTFHSPEWWRRHWGRTGRVAVEHADFLPDGWKYWAAWESVPLSEEWAEHCERWRTMLLEDAGRTLGFTRLIARRPEGD